MKCETCIYARTVISENGYHCVCSLSDKKAVKCIINDYKCYEDAIRFVIKCSGGGGFAILPKNSTEGWDENGVHYMLQPERKRGKWNWVGFNIECSECGAMPNFDSTEPLYNFCPNCGADMRGERDE